MEKTEITKMIPTAPVKDFVAEAAKAAEAESKTMEANGETKTVYPTSVYGSFHWTSEGNIVVSLLNGMDLLLKVKDEQTTPNVKNLDQDGLNALLAKTKKLGWVTGKVNRYNDTGIVVKYNKSRKERYDAMQAKEVAADETKTEA